MNFSKFLVVVSFLLYGISARGSKWGDSSVSRGSGQSSGSWSAGKRHESVNRGHKGKGGKGGKGNKGGYSSSSSSSSDIGEYELELEFEFDYFYNLQRSIAICRSEYASNCIDDQEYLSFFDDDCNICVPQNYQSKNTFCYSTLEYGFSLNTIYGEMKEIFEWKHEIKDIQISGNSKGNAYGGNNGYWGNGQGEMAEGYTVKVTVNKEYIEGRCEYRTCDSEEFEISNGKITSYKTTNININSRICEKRPKSWEKSTPLPSTSLPPTKPDTTTGSPTKPETTITFGTTKVTPSPNFIPPFIQETLPPTPESGGGPLPSPSPTSWEKSTTPQPSAPGPVPPSRTPSWSPTATPSPTTPSPTTPSPTPSPTTPFPTTPSPTTPSPTTPSPTTPSPTTPSPTTPSPTTPSPTTPSPTTPSPTTPRPTTPTPTTTLPPTQGGNTPKPSWDKTTTQQPKECNYNCNKSKCDDNQCRHGYKCVKEGYLDCSEYAYCPGRCSKEEIEH